MKENFYISANAGVAVKAATTAAAASLRRIDMNIPLLAC